MTTIILYGIASVILLVLDALWLGLITKSFYADQLGHLMRENVNFAIAAGFYLTYALGVVILAVKPALAAESWIIAAGYGALLGFIAYGTYNFTNMATLKDWPMMMSLVDITWGSFLTALVSVTTYGVFTLAVK